MATVVLWVGNWREEDYALGALWDRPLPEAHHAKCCGTVAGGTLTLSLVTNWWHEEDDEIHNELLPVTTLFDWHGSALYRTDERMHTGHVTTTRSLDLPLWFVLALFSILPTFRGARAILGRKNMRPGLCPACRYDLRATPGRCPECGWREVGGNAR